LIGFAISFLIFGFSSEQLWLMYLSRIMGGFFSGAATSCALAAITDLSSPEDRTKAMGIAGMSIGLGFVVGPALGAFLSIPSLVLPFFVAALFALINALYVWRNIPETNAAIGQEQAHESGLRRLRSLHGPVKYLFLLSLLVTYTLASIESTLYYFTDQRFEMTPTSFGMMLLTVGLVGALIQGGVVRRFVKPGTETRTIQLGLLLCITGFLLLLTAHGYAAATIYLCIFGAGNALIRPCVLSLITQKSGLNTGLATGLNTSMDSLGRILGPLISGALFQWNSGAPYVAGAILCIVSLFALFRFVRTMEIQQLRS
jgi:DHA1 family multidrug resistance protein-like MFS transporter